MLERVRGMASSITRLRRMHLLDLKPESMMQMSSTAKFEVDFEEANRKPT